MTEDEDDFAVLTIALSTTAAAVQADMLYMLCWLVCVVYTGWYDVCWMVLCRRDEYL
jgi:hypothetical protein